MTRLVRVKDGTDDEAVRVEHGYLWVHTPREYTRGAKSDPLQWYRSIATGYEHPWFDSEVEGAE